MQQQLQAEKGARICEGKKSTHAGAVCYRRTTPCGMNPAITICEEFRRLITLKVHSPEAAAQLLFLSEGKTAQLFLRSLVSLNIETVNPDKQASITSCTVHIYVPS